MTGKEFYTEFFGVKDPEEKGTTINVSVWRFAEAYAERIKQGQSLPIDIVVGRSEQLKCDCCNGTGMVEGDYIDELESCLTCNGRGTF